MDITALLVGALAVIAIRVAWWLLCELWPEQPTTERQE